MTIFTESLIEGLFYLAKKYLVKYLTYEVIVAKL